MVHQLKDVKVEKNKRTTVTACGKEIVDKVNDRLPDKISIWGSDVDCRSCLNWRV